VEQLGFLDVEKLRIEQVAGCCEYGNEPAGSIKLGEFLDWLTSC
jgi:hypothetical protein